MKKYLLVLSVLTLAFAFTTSAVAAPPVQPQAAEKPTSVETVYREENAPAIVPFDKALASELTKEQRASFKELGINLPLSGGATCQSCFKGEYIFTNVHAKTPTYTTTCVHHRNGSDYCWNETDYAYVECNVCGYSYTTAAVTTPYVECHGFS